MSYRAWIVAFAFGLTCGSLQAQEQTTGRQKGTSGQEQPSEPESYGIPVRIIEDQEAAEASQRSEKESAQREKDDLVAQQRMADATEAMNEATQSMKSAAWLSFGAVALGTALLVWTLFLTRSANKAARDAVKVTREAGLQQVRPWLVPISPSINDAGHIHFDDHVASETVQIIAVWANRGQSPAINATIGVETRMIRSNQEVLPFEWELVSGESIVGQGQTALSAAKYLRAEEFEDFITGRKHVLIASKAVYTHSLDEKTNSSTEVVFRISAEGTETNRDTGETYRRYQIDVVSSKVT